MTEFDKTQIDELLSGYIDGELSQRQHTEVKRLIQHDNDIAERFSQLQKQKQLLASLPVNSAPPEMLDNIKASLERQLILQEHPHAADRSAGARGLLFRRALTVAAMLLLPLGLLAWVVFTIVSPASTDSGGGQFSVNRPGVSDTGDSGVAVSTPFNPHLRLESREGIAVTDFIKKAVYSHALIDSTIPRSDGKSSSFQITSTSQRLGALLLELEPVWDKCETTSLTVPGGAGGSDIVVNNISSQRTVEIFKSPDAAGRIGLVRNFAGLKSGGDSAGGSDTKFDPSVPIKPMLTQPERPKIPSGVPEKDQNITLTITVIGL
jgi:hypothetical protein